MRNIAHIILFPLNWLWWFILTLRRAYYTYSSTKQICFDLPVISIGNISHGGTGKTPMTLWIAKFLENDYMPVIATRGYRSQVEKTGTVLLAGAGAQSSLHGDEPTLLHENLVKTDIIIGANRSKLLKSYFEKNNRDVLLLEDGFQHLQIRRDLDIVLLDAAHDIRATLFYPLQFREPVQTLGNAHIIILTNCHLCSSQVITKTKERIKPYLDKNCDVFEARYELSSFVHARTFECIDFADIEPETKVLAFCGLAKPMNFWNSLKESHIDLSYRIAFPDHHIYTRKDIEHIYEKANKYEKFMIVTTEKDIVKVKELMRDEENFYFSKVSLSFGGQESKLEDRLLKVLKQRGIKL